MLRNRSLLPNTGEPMPLNLDDPLDRAKLTLRIAADVDAACVQEFTEDPRTHLGASIIGNDCARYAWNVFRWVKFEQFSGQMYRLFNRGHEEEARFIRWLTLAGFVIEDIDPVTKKQFRIVGAKGHFGGSLDSKAYPPARYELNQAIIFLGEFKTHNEKSFAKLAGPKPKWGQKRTGGGGVAKTKPMHFKQMCSYGRAYNYQYGLYCAVNKDTDELYFEVVKLDYSLADDLFRKAEAIVFSQRPPPKIAEVETFFECKMCDFAGICHRGEVPVKNCRSCVHAFPVDDAQWFCELYSPAQGPIPKETIPVGCPSYRRIV
jgi:hypothetical protein